MAAIARAASNGGAPFEAASLRLRVRLDHGEWRDELYELGGAPRPLEIDLSGAGVLTSQVEYDGQDASCAWMAFENLRVERATPPPATGLTQGPPPQ